ncbi:MAG: hypothetical protein IKI93_03100 [Clostridia bacterium]|nr:hypothetical protein [Clostridia bacterium]
MDLSLPQAISQRSYFTRTECVFHFPTGNFTSAQTTHTDNTAPHSTLRGLGCVRCFINYP